MNDKLFEISCDTSVIKMIETFAND